MKIAVFDVDDTLIIHGESSQSYYAPSTDTYLRDLILQKGFDKIYIYTNGTLGHGENVCRHLNIYDNVSYIFGRDNLQQYSGIAPKHMKPHPESFTFVNNEIRIDAGIYNDDSNIHQIYFFDDLPINLINAKESVGWNTILIKPNGQKVQNIDHVHANIYSALTQIDF